MKFIEYVSKRESQDEVRNESLRRHSERDPFARQETVGTPVDAEGRTCDWCGGSRKDGKLYQYSVESDGGRTNELKGLFCCKGCFRDYHS